MLSTLPNGFPIGSEMPRDGAWGPAALKPKVGRCIAEEVGSIRVAAGPIGAALQLRVAQAFRVASMRSFSPLLLVGRFVAAPLFLFYRHNIYCLIHFPVVLAASLDTKKTTDHVLAVIIAMSFGPSTMFGIQSAIFRSCLVHTRYMSAPFGFLHSAAIGRGLSPIIATVFGRLLT